MYNKKPLFVIYFIYFIFLSSLPVFAQPNPSTTLWYSSPAGQWEDALPIGNGRLGAMYFGNIKEDRIQFNEDTYWTGGPYSTVKKGGYKVLPQIQQLLFEGKFTEAHLLFGEHLLGNPVEQQKYQNMGNVILDFNLDENASDYRRELDLTTGISKLSFVQNGVTYTREIFSSYPDQAIIMHITADKPGNINFNCQLQGVRNQAHSNYATDYFKMDTWGNDGLKLNGKSADYLGVAGLLKYEALLKAHCKGGTISSGVKTLTIKDADDVVLILVAATNFNNYKDVSGSETDRATVYIHHLEGRSYETLKAEHIKDYQQLFNRVSLSLPITKNSLLPTDLRMQKVLEAPDPSLAALGYQFGRYILMSSSRPGTQPANLQGIWNDDQSPAWDSKYTTNINTEMNYWNAAAGNLAECALPLFDLIKDVSDQGQSVAREHYGVQEGWVFHQNTDLWRVAAPMDGSNWGAFTTGGAWLCTHIWEHFQYTQDIEFLKKNYPLMKGCAQFFLRFLIKDPIKGWLVTNPSTSPENAPGSPNNTMFFDEMNGGYYDFSQLCYGSTIDAQILNDLFHAIEQASELLKIDESFRQEIKIAHAQLAPMQVGKDGSLQEWIEDWPQTEERHRHFSHLYGLYPGHVISAVTTPQLVMPVKQVLEQRGDGESGWSRVWKMCEWARLFDGNRANKIFKGYIDKQCTKSLFGKCYEPMQVDATLGLSAAVTEMLVQSQEGYIHLLPALPDEWSEAGHIQGVVTRGAFELDFAWKNGQVEKLLLTSKAGGICKIKSSKKLVVQHNGKKINTHLSENDIYSFETVASENYTIEFL